MELKKVLRPVLYSIPVLIGALAVLDFACERLENPRSHFDTYAEMEAAGWIERGWISKHLPRSATDIHESHDIDTNEVSVVFRFDPSDTETTRAACRLTVQTPDGLEFLCPPFENEKNDFLVGKGRNRPVLEPSKLVVTIESDSWRAGPGERHSWRDPATRQVTTI